MVVDLPHPVARDKDDAIAGADDVLEHFGQTDFATVGFA